MHAYMVVDGKKHTNVTTRKKDAIAYAKLHGGEVRAMPWSSYNDPSCSYGWDFPTFYCCSDRIYPKGE